METIAIRVSRRTERRLRSPRIERLKTTTAFGWSSWMAVRLHSEHRLRPDEFEPAWSVDGTEIAFVSGTGAVGTAIKSVNADGATKTIVTATPGAHVNSPSWSPDGQKMAYTQFSGRKTRLMVAGATVGAAEDVFPFPARWLSPEQILYTGDGKILVSKLVGETKTIPFQAKFLLNRPAYKHRQAEFDSTAARP
jgi:dipeptidyl aminopeptidase/acylaminoacyl peptidase